MSQWRKIRRAVRNLIFLGLVLGIGISLIGVVVTLQAKASAKTITDSDFLIIAIPFVLVLIFNWFRKLQPSEDHESHGSASHGAGTSGH